MIKSLLLTVIRVKFSFARLFALVLGPLLMAFVTEAQAMEQVPRIGVLSPFSLSNQGPTNVDTFRKGLQNLGYREGENIFVEYRWAEGHPGRLADLAAELVQLKVDVIVTAGMKGVRAARQATASIPIISGGAGDLVRGGLIVSLASPGGNITGLTDINPELNGKLLELLKKVVPGVSRVAYLYDALADPQTMALHLQEARIASKRLALQLQPLEVRDPKELDGAFAIMAKQDTDAMVTALSAFTLHHRRKIVALANQNHIPAVYQDKEFAEVGGLMSYGTDRLDQWRRATIYVDKILKGAKPADLPVQQPRKLEFVVNFRTAQLLYLTVPSAILYQADQIIR